jgi:hypothetical protein
MSPEKQAERIIAKYPDSLTTPQKDWWHENITAHIRIAIHAAEIETLEWALQRTLGVGVDDSALIRAEIERRRTK